MFNFCCSQNRPKDYYQLITTNHSNQTVYQYINDLTKIDQNVVNIRSTIIRPIQMSDYKEVLAHLKKNQSQFQDISFPAGQSSLGDVGVENIQWKRIPHFINYPTLFDFKIDPCDVIHKNSGDCYLLSAISALAQNPNIIRRVFQGQGYNQEGIYRLILCVDGIIQEVVIDDYIPLTEKKIPLFSQPKIRDLTGQFWTLLLEKAYAKVKKSYANIMEGTPSDVFRTVTCCPSQSLLFDQSQEKAIWDKLIKYTARKDPCCATTINKLSKYSGLVPQHTYTVLAAATILINDASQEGILEERKEKVVKLRDPWLPQNEYGWLGKAGVSDKAFWQRAERDRSYNILKQKGSTNIGVFTIAYENFLQYFNQLHLCDFQDNTKVFSQQLMLDKSSRGHFYDVDIYQKGSYVFQLSQSAISEQNKDEKEEQGICRLSIVLIEEDGEGKKTYKSGNTKHNSQYIQLIQDLKPGKYYVYALVEPTKINNFIPDSACLNIYSSFMTMMEMSNPLKIGNMLKQIFINDGIKYQKKIEQNNGKMTLSHRRLFQNGGFGYIVFHNQETSDKAFIIRYDEEQFDKKNLMVLEPQKHDKNFDIRVLPGHNMIILVRAKNQKLQSLSFPPKMSVKLQPLFG